MKPPKCRTCGVEEWQHTCGPSGMPSGAPIVTAVTIAKPERKGGRAKIYASDADRQRAHRERKKSAQSG